MGKGTGEARTAVPHMTDRETRFSGATASRRHWKGGGETFECQPQEHPRQKQRGGDSACNDLEGALSLGWLWQGEGRGRVAGSLAAEGDLVRALAFPRFWTDLIERVFQQRRPGCHAGAVRLGGSWDGPGEKE